MNEGEMQLGEYNYCHVKLDLSHVVETQNLASLH